MTYRNWIILIFFLLPVLAGHAFIYDHHRKMWTEEGGFNISSIEITNKLSLKTNEADKKYLNKTTENRFGYFRNNGTNFALFNKIILLLATGLNPVTKESEFILHQKTLY